MATPHTCHVDCELIIEGTRKSHMMYAAEPSSAAGRYQWELNRGILNEGRRAWRASGQGQSRACRAWDEMRRESESFGDGHLYIRYGVMGRRFTRELAEMEGDELSPTYGDLYS